MGSEWKETTLGESFEVNPPRLLNRNTVTPFVPMDALPAHARAIERIDARKYSGSGTRFRNGDTLIARITPCLENGKTVFVSGLGDGEVAHGSTEYIVVSGLPGKSDPLFGYYLARSPGFRKYAIGQMEGTSGRQRVPASAVEKFRFLLPPLNEQRAIAYILGRLDDKIELNRQQNQTLEAMARALFKAWFVDFEPVRAKMSGRWKPGQSLPGLPAHLYDLFPDRLVESEFGEIPAGWRMGVLEDVATHPRRGLQPDQIKDETPYIALEHMPKRSIVLAEWAKAKGLESNKYQFKRGEILFGKLRPYFHKVGVAPVNGVCSTDIVVISPKTPIWFGFVLAHASSDEFVEYTNAGSTGTKMPRTSWGEMARYKVVVPCEAIADAFNQHLKASSEEIIAKIHDSKSLALLRDTLLPKLISGELRISGVEKLIRAII